MDGEIPVRNPRTGAADYAISRTSAEVIAGRVAEMRAAQPGWVGIGREGRSAALGELKSAIARHRAELIDALAADTGRLRISVQEVDGLGPAIDRLIAMAEQLDKREAGRSEAMPQITFETQRVPYAVVGVISPWNFPLTLSLIDTLPALMAGAAVAIKPSEITPRFAAPLRAVFADVPEIAAVTAIFDGDGATGATLVDHADAICFTGSVTTGRKVAEAAARNFIPAFLELGGNDPAIVLEDADLDRAVTALLRGSVLNTGQACQSIERIYVARPLYDRFVGELTAAASEVTTNAQDIHQGQLGPIIFEKQAATIERQLDDARAKGAVIHTGGEIEAHGGNWLRPTVVTEVTDDMALMTEETFGPVLPVIPFDTEDEAVAAANNTEYGLSAAVFSEDLASARRVAERIDAGGISINDAALTGLMHEAEKNSFKLSGMGGSRMGPAGYLRFFRKKALITNTGPTFPIHAFDESGPLGSAAE